MTLHALLIIAALAAAPDAGTTAAAPASPKVEPAPPKAAPAEKPLDPDVKKAVDAMQKFYEDAKDFRADFHQIYRYKSFATTSEASGQVIFAKLGPSMRWDFQKPDVKVFVITGETVYAYIKEAKQLFISRISADRLSASVTFLWGQGKLEREFRISKAEHKDLKGGVTLELVPRVVDPRFQKIYFLLDPKVFSVKETIVVDPDGSENHMVFSKVKTNTGVDTKDFKIDQPADTEIKHMDAP